MKIEKFDAKHAEEMAELFAKTYSVPGYEWDTKTSRGYLERDYKYYPDYCYMALDDDSKIMGAVFCMVDPYFKSKMLLVDSIQVKEKYRKRGVAKKLLLTVFEKAKSEKFHGVHFLVDETLDFPRGWYEKLGFKKSSWVEYEADMDNINFALLEL